MPLCGGLTTEAAVGRKGLESSAVSLSATPDGFLAAAATFLSTAPVSRASFPRSPAASAVDDVTAEESPRKRGASHRAALRESARSSPAGVRVGGDGGGCYSTLEGTRVGAILNNLIDLI